MGEPENDRSAVVEAHMGIVHSVADRVVARMPRCVERDDLRAYGAIGLIEAAQDYRPGRGIPFAAYAAMKVRYAILDGVRDMDPVKRHHRRRYGAESPMSLSEALNRDNADSGEKTVCYEDVLPGKEPDPAHASQTGRMEWERLFAPLSPTLRAAATMIYRDGATQREAAKAIGVSESQVCQWMRRAHVVLAKTTLAEARSRQLLEEYRGRGANRVRAGSKPKPPRKPQGGQRNARAVVSSLEEPFRSCIEASRAMGKSDTSVASAIRRGHACAGRTWRFADEMKEVA